MGCWLAEASQSDTSVSWISARGLAENVLSTQGMQFIMFIACVAMWRMILDKLLSAFIQKLLCFPKAAMLLIEKNCLVPLFDLWVLVLVAVKCKAGGWRYGFILGCFWVGTVREVLGYPRPETRPPPLETPEQE